MIFDPIEDIEEQAIKDAQKYDKWVKLKENPAGKIMEMIQEEYVKEINNRILNEMRKGGFL